MAQRSNLKRRSAGPQQQLMMRRQTYTTAPFSDVEANEQLAEIHKDFADAAAGPDPRLGILAQRIDTLRHIFLRLRISLQQTKRPFIGYDGFQKTLLACSLFIQCFNPPSNHGRKWFCSDSEIEARDAEIVTEISLLTTSIIVLLAETYFSNDDRESGAATHTSQPTAVGQLQTSSDPEIEQFEQFWANISRLVYGRKRKFLQDSSQTTVPTTKLKEEVSNNLRRLLLNGAKLIPAARLNPESQDFQSPHKKKDLHLEALSDEELLEINQQQERFGRAASQKRAPPTAAQFRQFERTDYFSAPSRAWTLESESELLISDPAAPLPSPTLPPIQDGNLFINDGPPYRLASIKCKVIEKKRKVVCLTVENPQLTIIHELPPLTKRYPRTTHPRMIEQNTPDVDFSGGLHVKINSIDVPGEASIKYIFSKPGSLKAFQSMVREKDLIETFCVNEIKSAIHHIEASSQHLKVWKDHKTGDYTFSFYRNGLAKQHLECPLNSFELKSARQPRNRQIVRLDFIDEVSPLQRASSHDSNTSPSLNPMKKRDSIASFDTMKSADKAASVVKQREQLRNAAASVIFLSIEFSSIEHANEFRTLFKKVLDDQLKDMSSTAGSEGSSSPIPGAARGKSRSNSNQRPEAPVDLQFAPSRSQFQPARLGNPPLSHPLVDPFLDALKIRSSGASLSESTSMVRAEDRRRYPSDLDYTVGWICALPIEFSAAMVMLDTVHQAPPKHVVDKNAYEVGRIGNHNVVIACLPKGMMGTISASTVAAHMSFSFPNIITRLMVGIGGGVPSATNDVRLGDVVVCKPGPLNNGIVQYDFGKRTGDGFEQTGHLPSPPQALLTVISRLEARHDIHGSTIPTILQNFDTEHMREKFGYPGADHDELFQADYAHITGEATCAKCDRSRLQVRSPRRAATVVHYGAIASGNSVMKDAVTRDELGQRHGVLCFEMEAAGLMNAFPCLVIRGICDYSDTHKNKEWQGYAAAAAAAYAKELLINT